MNNAYYISANSLISQERMFSVLAGNISNINTDGYKRTTLDFADLMYNRRDTISVEQYLIGNGMKADWYSKDFTPGPIRQTEDMYDFAFEKDGFLLVEDGGEQFLTRGGSFYPSKVQDSHFLANSSGLFLLDESMQRIEILPEDGEFEVDEKGLLVFETSGRQVQLALRSYQNPEDLEPLGNNLYQVGINAKENTLTADIELRQGWLESSNVDLAVEMTEMIKTQRIYQMNSKMIQVMDEISGMVNRLRR